MRRLIVGTSLAWTGGVLALLDMTLILTVLLSLHATGLSSDSLSAVPSTARTTAASPLEADEILWLARCIYSESDRPHEQRLVAWVVRNRVETGFRGNTYREVVLEDRQFSAFNDPTPRRARILAFTEHDRNPAWRKALEIARDVYHAPPAERPFPISTRHFYSPVSMRGRSVPHWAESESALHLAGMNVDPHRFQFFAEIDSDEASDAAFGPARARIESATPHARSSRRLLRMSGRVARPVPPEQPVSQSTRRPR